MTSPVLGATNAPQLQKLSEKPPETKRNDVTTTPVASSKTQVTITSAAVLAAQEAVESTAQTAQEARTGDRQAMRLVAKQALSHELLTGNKPKS